MEISINTAYAAKRTDPKNRRSDLEAARICKAAGYTVLDCTPAFATDDDYETKAYDLANALAAEGLRVEQAHAPFNRYAKQPFDQFQERLRRSFHTARILGVRYHVVHADEYPLSLPYDSAAACDYAYEYLAPLAEYAEKHGFSLAVENLFDEPCFPSVDGRNRFTATIEEQIAIIDRLGGNVTACWDFGHGNVSYGKDGLEKLGQLGSRLTCTHVHDNLGEDKHLPLYFGNMDWDAYAQYICQSYKGVFTYEFVYHTFPEALLPDYLRLAKRTAEELLGRYEK